MIAGAFLGTLVASLYLLRSIWRLDSVAVVPAGCCCAAGGAGAGGAGTPDTAASLLRGGGGASDV